MVMNKKGQQIFLGIMISIMAFIVIILFIPVLKDFIIDTRADMSCGSADITTGVKMTCILVDLYLFYIVGAAIAAAIGYIFTKKVVTT